MFRVWIGTWCCTPAPPANPIQWLSPCESWRCACSSDVWNASFATLMNSPPTKNFTSQKKPVAQWFFILILSNHHSLQSIDYRVSRRPARRSIRMFNMVAVFFHQQAGALVAPDCLVATICASARADSYRFDRILKILLAFAAFPKHNGVLGVCVDHFDWFDLFWGCCEVFDADFEIGLSGWEARAKFYRWSLSWLSCSFWRLAGYLSISVR